MRFTILASIATSLVIAYLLTGAVGHSIGQEAKPGEASQKAEAGQRQLIVLKDRNGCGGKTVAEYPSNKRHYGQVNPNDEARSMLLIGVEKDTIIKLYDDRDGNENQEDWCEIRVLESGLRLCVDTFNQNDEEPGRFRIRYHKVNGNGVDGHVSYIRIH
jgi:hypothetical protein